MKIYIYNFYNNLAAIKTDKIKGKANVIPDNFFLNSSLQQQ